MPRYVVEREFPDGLQVPMDENGARACQAVVASNAAASNSAITIAQHLMAVR